MRQQLVHGQQRALDLRGIEVDALDDQHVVRASLEACDARAGASAGARRVAQRRDVAGAVADERQRALGEGREHELALLAHWPHRAGGRVDDLGQEMIVGHVQTLARLALAGHAGTDDLGQSVDVVRRRPERALEGAPQPLGPRLGAIEAVTQTEGARITALRRKRLGDVQRERGCGAEPGGPQVLQQQDLARGVAGRRGDDAEADALGAVVEAQAAGEQAVAERVLQRVARAGAGAHEHARHHLAPDVQVARRVAHDGRLALRARRGVQPRELARRDGEQPERIVLPQIALARERQRGEIGEPAQSAAAQPLRVEGHALGGPGERDAQPLPLQRLARRSWHALGGGIPDHRRGFSRAGAAGAGTADRRRGGDARRPLRAGSRA